MSDNQLLTENPYIKAVKGNMYNFDSSCKLKLLVSNKPDSWNGAVRFHVADTELLLVGMYPHTNTVAVRNAVFTRGTLNPKNMRIVPTPAYPEPDSAGRREYSYEFTETGINVKCGGMV